MFIFAAGYHISLQRLALSVKRYWQVEQDSRARCRWSRNHHGGTAGGVRRSKFQILVNRNCTRSNFVIDETPYSSALVAWETTQFPAYPFLTMYRIICTILYQKVLMNKQFHVLYYMVLAPVL